MTGRICDVGSRLRITVVSARIVVLPTDMLVLLFVLGAVSALAGVGITWGLVTRTSRKK
jgi:hypothetical protein